ncbi:2-hydroxyacid dehydrogenase [Falsirhodobacter sp. alg1]|uniref:2-hydroxyacid dehydrogenase n=1 Tax=Falsirhodobacter sp. alg1 TaxID=1472418 RepID=UPI0005EE342C|nr:2-hydroxyacid dehydrogenase [Falsirhodobacter sp. alg1]
MKPDILIVNAPPAPQMEQLQREYTIHRVDQAEDKDALIQKVGPSIRAIYGNGHCKIDEALLAQLPELGIVSCSSAGYEAMDVDALTRAGVHLTNTSKALDADVADAAILLMLAARRRLVEADAYVRSGDWGRKGMFPLTTCTAGKRVGIVGLGNIGGAIARRCEAFDLEVGYSGRNPKDVTYQYFSSTVALAEWADILIAATTGGEGTRHLVSAEVLAALGPDGCFVNIARGSVVDEPALIAALKEGRIASAGLDVFMDEPAPAAELTSLPNVTLYPHHASGTVETRNAMHQLAVDNLAAYFAGKPLLTPVNSPD